MGRSPSRRQNVLALQKRNADTGQPHNAEAETATLGGILLQNAQYPAVAEIISASSFWRQAHGQIFSAMGTLHARGVPIDLITLTEELTRTSEIDAVGGPACIAKLVDGVPRSSHVEYYARIIRDKATERSANAIAADIQKALAAGEDVNGVLRTASQRIQQLEVVSDEVSIADRLPDFLARELSREPVPAIVDGFIHARGITLAHGQPRVLKTWMFEALGLCVSHGCDLFGTLPTRQMPVLYLTSEDAAVETAARLDALVRGMGIRKTSRDLHLMVERGVSLDDAVERERIMRYVQREGIGLVIAEPLRSLTDAVDQGPRELRPFATFLRAFQRETGCALVLGHHDTKPMAGMKDDRARPQRASGGGLFSIADSPIHIERTSEDPAKSLLVPSAWKFGKTPSPLEITLLWDKVSGATLTAQITTAENAAEMTLHGRIRDFLMDRSEASGRDITRGVHADRNRVAKALEVMFARGLVDSRNGERNARLWFLRAAEQAA